METWSAAALALALSVDGLAVGVAYGARRIRVPVWSLAIIGTCSAACFFVAATVGGVVAGAIGGRAPHIIGCFILVGLGLWHVGQGWLHVLREPVAADLDRSGTIDAGEAALLGFVLGLDALAAGFGAAFIGSHPAVALLVAASQILLTGTGLWLGRERLARWLGEKGFFVPGVILITLGLLQL